MFPHSLFRHASTILRGEEIYMRTRIGATNANGWMFVA